MTRLGEQRIADPHGIDPDRLGVIGQRQDFSGLVNVFDDPLAGRQQITDFECHMSNP